MIAVLDTNIFVSTFIQPLGTPSRAVERWLTGRFEIALSAETLAEVRDVAFRPSVVRRMRQPAEWVATFLGHLDRATLIVVPDAVDAIPEDPPDNLVLGTATAAHADVIVSGNAHLLRLGSFRGIPILTPRQFLDLLDRLDRGSQGAGHDDEGTSSADQDPPPPRP